MQNSRSGTKDYKNCVFATANVRHGRLESGGKQSKEGIKLALWEAKKTVACELLRGSCRQKADTVEALNIASATKAHVDTASVASPAACGPLAIFRASTLAWSAETGTIEAGAPVRAKFRLDSQYVCFFFFFFILFFSGSFQQCLIEWPLIRVTTGFTSFQIIT